MADEFYDKLDRLEADVKEFRRIVYGKDGEMEKKDSESCGQGCCRALHGSMYDSVIVSRDLKRLSQLVVRLCDRISDLETRQEGVHEDDCGGG